jgi:homoserine dehydrogenase
VPDPLRIAIAGLGTVGAGTLRLLSEHGELLAARAGRPLTVTAVSARDKSKDRGVPLDELAWFDDPVAMAQEAEADVVVELIGGQDGPAKAVFEAALAAGRHIVTANKALLAVHGSALAEAAEQAGSILNFEAAVAGGIPIVKALREGLAGNEITRVYGILNGTCYYILTEMREQRRSFDDVLEEAQRLGYAEAEPSMDVDGIDAGQKLALLASLAFGSRINFSGVYTEGIRRISLLDIDYAEELGYRIKLLGSARLTEHGLEQRVYPCMVDQRYPIAHVEGAYNAVVAIGDFVNDTMYQGQTLPEAPIERHRGPYYVRLMVSDRPGVIADVTAVFRDEQVSIESMIQRARSETEAVPVVLNMHECEEAAMQRALSRIAALDSVVEAPTMIRIESLA